MTVATELSKRKFIMEAVACQINVNSCCHQKQPGHEMV